MTVRTHIMFQGEAQAALELHAGVFERFHIGATARHGAGEGRPEGALKTAEVDFDGHALLVFDSPPIHDFTFTPSISLMVDMPDAESLDAAGARLAEDGSVLMPPGDHGIGARHARVRDRFGVSWQLSLPS